MATRSVVVLLQPIPISNLNLSSSSSSSSTTQLVLPRNTSLTPSSVSLKLKLLSKKQRPLRYKSLSVSLALAESDSAKSLEPDPQSLLQQLAVSHIQSNLVHDCKFSANFFYLNSDFFFNFFHVGFLCRIVLIFPKITFRSFHAIFVSM